jgi:glycosyltransferase involved in cell wall biosynthesis
VDPSWGAFPLPAATLMPARALWLIKGLGRGGAERLVTLMAPAFDRSRYEIDVAYIAAEHDGFARSLRVAGIHTICLGARRELEASWLLRLRRLVRDGEYDLVHTHSPLPASVARLLVRRDVPLIHTEHNLWDAYRWPTAVANAITLSRNEAIFAVSDGVRASMVRPWWGRFGAVPAVETLRHGVDVHGAARGPDARARGRELLGLDHAAPVIGNVANLNPKKDQAGLLIAVDKLRASIPEVMLLLIGAGPLEHDLRSQVDSRGLGSNVRFLGSRDDVGQLLPALDVFVLGSRFEGLPISLLEAMAAEVACVATSVGGIPEAIADGVDGRLVPPGQPDILAEALATLLLDPQHRAQLAAAGRRRVEADFSIDRAVRRTEALYAQVLP